MNWLNSYGIILTIFTLIIGAGVYLFGTAKRGRADIVRQDNADLRASNQDKVSKIAGLEATVAGQTKQIADLQSVATQTPEVKALLAATAKQQQIINKQHADVIGKLSDLAEAISNMTAEFSKVVQAMGVNTKAQDKNTAERRSNGTT